MSPEVPWSPQGPRHLFNSLETFELFMSLGCFKSITNVDLKGPLGAPREPLGTLGYFCETPEPPAAPGTFRGPSGSFGVLGVLVLDPGTPQGAFWIPEIFRSLLKFERFFC